MIRFGIIGTNWITEAFLSAAMKHDDFQLNAVYSRTEERASEFSKKYEVTQTYTCLEQMATSNQIDAVYIASPNSFHKQQAILFMKNKKHVLCEKPLASNRNEVQEMIKVAKENDVLLMEALKTTFLPNFQAIRESLDTIKPVRKCIISYCQYSSRYDAYKKGTVLNAFKREYSNGSLMDIGIYCLYPLVLLFGKPQEIKATGYLLDTGVDGEGSLLLKYPDMEAVVTFSKITNSYISSEIQGEEGSIVVDKINPPEKVSLMSRDGSKVDISREQSKHPMYYEVEEFIDLIKQGKKEPRLNTFECSLAVMELMDEARRQMGVVYPSD